MTQKTHHVAEKKKQVAKQIQKLILEYPIIAAVNMENLPAPQLQQMKAQLRGKIVLAMTKRRIMKHAIEGVKDKKQNIELIEPHLKGMPALIFTKENPFSLFKTLKKSKTSAPAKAGQTAPSDIKVPKGPTGFAPGPVIGELAQLKIKAGVENGKVVIKEDSIMVKAGEKIPAKAAEILTRLGIHPMEVGLNVTAVYEGGNIFTASVLDIDETKFQSDLEKAATWAFNLAVESAYPTKETMNTLIAKAFNDAKAIGLSQNIIDEGIIDELLGKAERSALSVKSTANIETAVKPKEAPKKETPQEKKEEKPVETPKEQSKPEVKTEEKKDIPKEKKEEKVLEEENAIMEEETKLEKEAAKPKIEAPVEKEVEKAVKEEEEKQLENERIEKEKEFEKIEKEKTNAPKDETDKRVEEMVAKTKEFAESKTINAEKIVEEASKSAAKEMAKDKPKKEKKKEQAEVEKLAQELLKKGTLRK
ncbi:MAG: 50S ribosomal protein L10 [Nanoarchaeota archaeon]